MAKKQGIWAAIKCGFSEGKAKGYGLDAKTARETIRLLSEENVKLERKLMDMTQEWNDLKHEVVVLNRKLEQLLEIAKKGMANDINELKRGLGLTEEPVVFSKEGVSVDIDITPGKVICTPEDEEDAGGLVQAWFC